MTSSLIHGKPHRDRVRLSCSAVTTYARAGRDKSAAFAALIGFLPRSKSSTDTQALAEDAVYPLFAPTRPSFFQRPPLAPKQRPSVRRITRYCPLPGSHWVQFHKSIGTPFRARIIFVRAIQKRCLFLKNKSPEMTLGRACYSTQCRIGPV